MAGDGLNSSHRNGDDFGMVALGLSENHIIHSNGTLNMDMTEV